MYQSGRVYRNLVFLARLLFSFICLLLCIGRLLEIILFSNLLQICGGGCDRGSASSGGGDKVRLGSCVVLGF